MSQPNESALPPAVATPAAGAAGTDANSMTQEAIEKQRQHLQQQMEALQQQQMQIQSATKMVQEATGREVTQQEVRVRFSRYYYDWR